MDLQCLIGQEGLSGSGGARARRGLLVFDRRTAPVRLVPVHTLLTGDPLLLRGWVLGRQRLRVETLSRSASDYLLTIVLLYDVQRSGCLERDDGERTEFNFKRIEQITQNRSEHETKMTSVHALEHWGCGFCPHHKREHLHLL